MSPAPVRDRFLTCASCGVRFVWSREEQAGAEGGAPVHCPGCRALERLLRDRTGTVKWYDARRGFGFIRSDDGAEVFVHRSALPQRGILRIGQRVLFHLERTPDGLKAAEVRRQDESPAGGI